MLIASAACQESTENIVLPVPEASPTIMPTQEPTPSQDSPIRGIDFKNFTYPWTKGLMSKEKTFTLKNGRFDNGMGVSLRQTKYADLTGDGEDEAILFMLITTGGSASPGIVYVYSFKNRKPQLLWKFDTGDRAEGGFKDLYAENGNVIVELFGENKLVSGEWKAIVPPSKDKGLCCPTIYTKTTFSWDGKQFNIQNDPEVFDIPQGN